ncbi:MULTISPECIES: type II toxin-antitoxin system HipA family toxin [unclassified Legionella]|uniref:type II toxin-antitoxin system HipA family toxin n=1 Tax=unclassified Legionella TaxID=2622702 RepID=UPI001E2A1DFE|nr:type II toxin-antitoxin system HipA family toxin [Legionella sp. 31fI33]MCC5014110.1 type II toxin-antitoxin system HipA family toxin [Legionella sp. 31fI33]
MVTAKRKNRILSILMNGILIGKLEKTTTGGLIFIYDQQWLNTPGARPISLSLPLTEQPFSGDIVYNFFDNLLPDNQQIRSRIQAKFHVAINQPFDLLASIGRDCVGAVQIIDGEIPAFKKEIKAEPLDEKTIAAILRGYQNNPLGMTDPTREFRISIAGAQEKSAFLYHQKKWCRPLEETPTSHIFKLPIGYIPHQNMDLRDSCENEWLCSHLAAAFGLPVAKCEILHFEETKVLVVERFDRKMSSDNAWIMRLPQEDICQVLGISPNLKYQSDGGAGISEIMQLLLGATNPIADRDMFYRAQVLFWLLAAIDGHAKNFSVFIEPQGKYHLTPLYDIMSAYPLIEKKQLQAQKIKMAMALRGKNTHYHWHSMQRRHFLDTAKAVNYSTERAETILDEMLERSDAVINEVAAKLPGDFPNEIAQPIFTGIHLATKKLK